VSGPWPNQVILHWDLLSAWSLICVFLAAGGELSAFLGKGVYH
jgi:hypothetical protein